MDPAAIRTFSARGSALAAEMHAAQVSINGAAAIAAIITDARRESMLVPGATMDEGFPGFAKSIISMR